MNDVFWILAIIFMVFIFQGDPDIYDKAHAAVMKSLSTEE